MEEGEESLSLLVPLLEYKGSADTLVPSLLTEVDADQVQ